jgi:hypothetical protein
MNYSLTHGGILAMIALPVLVHFGFSEQCGSEIMAVAPMIPGAVMAWVGRIRAGGTSVLGFKA